MRATIDPVEKEFREYLEESGACRLIARGGDRLEPKYGSYTFGAGRGRMIAAMAGWSRAPSGHADVVSV